MTNFIQKFALTTNDMYEQIMSLLVEDVRAIVSLCHHDVDLLEDAISSQMIKICVYKYINFSTCNS